MLHKRLEPVTKTFNTTIRRVLNNHADALGRAKEYQKDADRIRHDARRALVDAFGTITDGGSAAYYVNGGPQEGNFLCLDMAVRYEADTEKLAKVLGDRIRFVTTTVPVFDRHKAEAAIKVGMITETELATCVTAVPRLTALVRPWADAGTPKALKPGEACVAPLQLVKPLQLDWKGKAQ